MTEFGDAAMTSKAWPFEEARKLVKRFKKAPPEKGYVLFETGYGPSGLPHIGTFGEVARTTMVRQAFEAISDIPTRLVCFSDDLDGMRKVPENVPNSAALQEYLQRPLSDVPDPFGTYDSFADNMNARLNAFLDRFGFEYEFVSSTEFYRAGKFAATLLKCAEKYQDIMDIMLPTLGAERQATYSPFLPISPTSGRVLYVPMKNVDAAKGEITFDDEDGTETTLSVTGGAVKLQWKPDFGARWAQLGVDFEMFGKDHSSNSIIYDRICRKLGAPAPEHYVYELFLDGEGQKISKSKGNGLTIDEWLTYASAESLSQFMFQKPRTAKRMHWDVIPRAVDEYHQHLRAYPDQEADKQAANPAWHIHNGQPPKSDMVVPFSMLLNLASAASADDKDVLWGFIRRYAPDATAESHPGLDAAAGFAVRYFNDYVKPTKTYRAPDDRERQALEKLSEALRAWTAEADGDELQSLVFAIGKAAEFDPLRDWFKAIYEVLLGASQGPRFGGFIALYGVSETSDLIDQALAGKFIA
ncbi:MAG: lysine--tRNA ligase [Pseudomonadales bacterium]|nr:lysine--tRNA ligase [Pseudomonadales bacterium]